MTKHSRQWFYLQAIPLAFLLILPPSGTEASSKDSYKVFQDSSRIMAEIELRQGADAVVGEIAVAKKWIEQGVAHLKKREYRLARILAEKLPIQIELIRVLLERASAEAELRNVEREIGQIESTIEASKKRLERMSLLLNGNELTSAYPGKD